MFELSHSTTLPTAPVVAWLISSSTVKLPDGELIFIALVTLKVVPVAADPFELGSLSKTIFLKS